MIPVTKTFLPSLNDYTEKLESVWKAGWLTNNGAVVRELHQKLESFLGVSGMELVANGTLALQLAIKALDLKGEIITTPYSYVATTTAILWEGCEPVFVDIDEDTFCIDPNLIEDAVTSKTSAILATHVYGLPCDVGAINVIAKKYNLKVIYDAAHCFGVNLDGKSLLLYGDCSILSFHATKLFHTVEGGAVISRDEGVSKKISLMKKFGHMGEEEYLDIGINAKMSELHAAMGLCVLPKMKELIQLRKVRVELYDLLLDESNLRVMRIPNNLEYNYSYYPVIFSTHVEMMGVRKALIDGGIMPRRYFYPSLNTLPYLNSNAKSECPLSEDIAKRVLALPLSHELDLADVELIAGIINEAVS